MKENTNKAIVINSIYLYVRLAIMAVSSLLTTRFALRALGDVDFGLFSVITSIIACISVLNTVMLSTSNRYIAVAIGKGNTTAINEQFNINLIIHIGIALLTLLIAIPLGDLYIIHYINYAGNIDDAVYIYNYTIVAAAISFIGVPYNGLLMAKERFSVFCITDSLVYVLKCVIAFILIYLPFNQLRFYGVSIAILSAFPALIYWLYCTAKFHDFTSFHLVKELGKYKSVFMFSIWIGYGAMATVARNQGASLIINRFFNTVMNAALGVAHSINSLLQLFSENVSKPIAPQITKSYASGAMDRCEGLLVLCTKLSFFAMFIISAPILLETDWIITVWLGRPSEYASLFTVLFIIDALVTSLNSGISNYIFATGNIKLYQIVINSNRILAVVLAFFALKAGAPAYSMLVCYIIISVINVIVIQIILNRIYQFNSKKIIRESYLPSGLVVLLFLLLLPLKHISLHPMLVLLIAFVYLAVVIAFVGFNKKERAYAFSFLRSKLK